MLQYPFYGYNIASKL